jgi:hypothetical protein
MRTHYQSGILKQYVRDHVLLRTEPASTNVYRDYGIPKAIASLPRLRTTMQAIADRYPNVRQEILGTFLERFQLHHLHAPTVLPNGKRIPALKLDHPANSRSCRRSCAFHTSRRRLPSPRKNSTRRRRRRWASRRPTTNWNPSVTIYPSSARRAC